MQYFCSLPIYSKYLDGWTKIIEPNKTATTVIALSIGKDRPLQQYRPRSDAAECHTYSNILDTSNSSRMYYLEF